jgi:membrane-bound toxin of toxin-antitoxin system
MDKAENPFLVTLRLPVKTSPIVLFVGILVHFVCLFIPWLTGLEPNIKIILTCLTLASFCFYLHKYCVLNVKAGLSELILGSEDNWQVKMNDGAVHQAKLGDHLFVHPWLTIILLYYDTRKDYFIFTPDIIDADLFRRLRVRLRFPVG